MLAIVFVEVLEGRKMTSEGSEVFTGNSSKGRYIYEDSKFGCLRIKLNFLYFGRKEVCCGIESRFIKLRAKSAFMRVRR